jgi:hypothetical protein
MVYNDKRKTDRDEYKNYANFDECIDVAKETGKVQVKTSPFDEMDGIVGMDDIDRIRREKLRHQTK